MKNIVMATFFTYREEACGAEEISDRATGCDGGAR
jgi:hypothetical protein